MANREQAREEKPDKHSGLKMLLAALLAALAVFGIGVGLNLFYTTPTLVQSASLSIPQSQGLSGMALAFSSKVSSGDLITVATAWYSNASGSVSSITEAAGTAKLGTPVRVTSQDASGGGNYEEVEVWYAKIKGSGSLTLSVNFTGEGDLYAIAQEVSGITASGLSSEATNGTLSGSPTTISVPTFTPSYGSFVLGVASFDGGAKRANPSVGDPTFLMGAFGGAGYQQTAAEEYAVNWDGIATTVPITANPSVRSPYAWCEVAVSFPNT